MKFSWLCLAATLLLLGCAPGRTLASIQPTVAPVTATSRNIIGVLAGHHGESYGATCPDGVKEVDITTAIAARIQAKLQTAGYQVDVLDEFDPRLENYQAKVFVAVHADSCLRGASGFKVAGREMSNQAGDALAACLQGSYRQATGLEPQPFGITPAMTHYYAFDRLAPDTPAAIIELGFISNDRAVLIDQPDRAVQGVHDGIVCFLSR